jgi:hypothetical protein
MILPRHIQSMRRVFCGLVVSILACSALANASATLLLEEPYGTLGFFSGTGHVAVYLSGVCAETPLKLRACKPGETGVVISRYDDVNGYDWIAIPLIPYLYAVERPEDVPLYADAKMVAFLRDNYRRKYLAGVAPDGKNGEVPGGNWYELVGTSYDRTVYGFDIETTPERDAELIEKLNSSPNVSHFHTVSRNCADFVKSIINFYYPHALHRSFVADIGISTPKQMAKMLTKYGARHPELQFSRMVIAQTPGSMGRSTDIRGVVDGFFRSKKYIVPSAVVSPIFAGCVAAVYFGTGAGRFEPAKNATVFVVGSDPERQLSHEDLRAYQLELKHLLAGTYPEKSEHSVTKAWEKLQAKAVPALDAQGRPILQMRMEGDLVEFGASPKNILSGNAPPQLLRELLEARLDSELHNRSPHGISETEVDHDWRLLQMLTENEPPVATRPAPRATSLRGNQP